MIRQVRLPTVNTALPKVLPGSASDRGGLAGASRPLEFDTADWLGKSARLHQTSQERRGMVELEQIELSPEGLARWSVPKTLFSLCRMVFARRSHWEH